METPISLHKDAQLVIAAWDEIRRCLEEHRERTYAEIRGYPTPITACDQQFNYLLDERTAISRELDRLRRAAEQCTRHCDRMGSIQAFIDSSDFVDEATKQRIKVLLSAIVG